MYRRYDHLMRDLCDQIVAQIRSGDMPVSMAACRMARHSVPLPVALRVVREALQ